MHISIPAGPIKASGTLTDWAGTYEFQFLPVRLKLDSADLSLVLDRNFNSCRSD